MGVRVGVEVEVRVERSQTGACAIGVKMCVRVRVGAWARGRVHS